MNFKPDKELQEIISDNKSGSALLLEKLNKYLLNNFDSLDTEHLISYLKNSLPHFSNIQNYINELEIINNKNTEKTKQFFEDKIIEKSKTVQSIYKNCLQYLNNYKSFITISNSHTIFHLFKLFAENKDQISVTVSESRPIFEGRIMAEELVNINVRVKLITEAMIVNEIKDIDAAIIGADSILPNGNIINKVGSNLLALACNYFNKPLYVIADKSKIADSGVYHSSQRPVKEIWDSKPGKMEIDNYYFEVVDKYLITKIITD